MKWLILGPLAGTVVAVIWMSALLASETFAACPTREDAIRVLRDPQTSPIAPFGPLIRLALRLFA